MDGKMCADLAIVRNSLVTSRPDNYNGFCLGLPLNATDCLLKLNGDTLGCYHAGALYYLSSH